MKKFLYSLSILLSLILFASCKTSEQPNIMIVSGWQSLNVGDIAHTPGLISALKKEMPDANYTVWIWQNDSTREDVASFINKYYPDVKCVWGDVNKDFSVDSPEVNKAMDEADFMIHGSGPMILGEPHLNAFKKRTGKPYGIFGTTIQWTTPELTELLQGATFIFTRETASLDSLSSFGINQPTIKAIPDAVFSLNMNDDVKAETWLEEHNLKEGDYICVIPRLRRTPYAHFAPEVLAEIKQLNDSCKEMDHAKLRDTMTRYVRATGKKVVVCAEMTYQLPLFNELLIDKLPEDVKPYVLTHEYWWPDEGISFMRRAEALVSLECHSVIMTLANGTPAFYIRQKEDTIKGQMYYDLGFKDWVFEIDQTDGEEIFNRLMEIHNNPQAAQDLINKNISHATELINEGTNTVKELLLNK